MKSLLRKKTKRSIVLSRQTFPPIYNPPSADEQLRANQYFFGRDLNTAPAKNTIRFFDTITANMPTWMHCVLYSQDKSLTEWHAILQNYRSSIVFPFIRTHLDKLESLVMTHFQIRACVRKFVQKLRMRIAERRVIGEIDLYTTTRVPKSSQVRVYDLPNKSVYIFHTQTAVLILLSGLQHSIYGIPSPHMPKNPYTNVPFTLPQTMVMMEQIIINCARVHHLPHSRMFQFRRCMYKVDVFSQTFRHQLNIESARTFLHSFHDPTSIGYYMEVLNDAIETEVLDLPRWDMISKYLENRTMAPYILKRFDTIVLCLFLFQNHSVCYTFKSYDDMLNEVVSVYKAALQWWKDHPRTIVKRRLGVVAFGGAAAPQVGAQILQLV